MGIISKYYEEISDYSDIHVITSLLTIEGKELDEIDKQTYAIKNVPNKFFADKEDELINDLEYIIVGDNPGEEERKLYEDINYKGNCYFKSDAGNKLKDVLKDKLNSLGLDSENDFSNKVFILNKSSYSTCITSELSAIYKCSLFNKNLERNAVFINSIIEKKPSVKILLFGVKKSIFQPFYKKLSIKARTNCFLFKHPSRNWFRKDIHKCENKSEVLEHGKEQFKEFIK